MAWCALALPLDVGNFSSARFNSLPHIDAQPVHNEANNAIAAELSDVLIKHSLTDALGVILVHKHFDLAPGEAVVAWPGGSPYLITTSVEQVLDAPDAYVPYSWYLDSGRLVPLQFVPKDFPEAAPHLAALACKPEFLEDFAAKLKELNVEDTMGFCLRCIDVRASEHEHALVEHTDMHKRIQAFKVEAQAPAGTTYQTTFWAFRPFIKYGCQTIMCAANCVRDRAGLHSWITKQHHSSM